MSKPVMYVSLVAIIVVVSVLIFFTPAKESFQEWRADVPKETVGDELGVDDAQADTGTTIFSASPTSGSAPLDVTFHSNLQKLDRVEVHFGDNTPRQAFYSGIPHVYTSPGVYTAELVQWSGGIYFPSRGSYFDEVGEILRTVTITVR